MLSASTTTAFQGSSVNAWNFVAYVTNTVANPAISFTYSSGSVDAHNRFYADAVQFQYLADAATTVEITGFSPGTGPAGTAVTITGTAFDAVTAVRFNGTSAAFTLVSSTEIHATVPATATTGKIEVATPFGSVLSSTDFIVSQPPAITSFSPASGPVGSLVTISGASLGGATTVTFNGLSADFTVVSSSSITATVPANATTGRIAVTTPDGSSVSATDFVVTQPPTISSFSPIGGTVGSLVTINGANLDAVTAVKFNGVTAPFTVLSASSIRATVPSGANTGPISVTSPSGSAQTEADFTIVPGTPGHLFADPSAAGLPAGTEYPPGSGHLVGLNLFASLQAAIEAASPGDQIHVAPGDYSGVTIGKNLALTSANGAVVHGASPALTVTGGMVAVTNITFTTATDDPAILVTGGALTLSGCVVQPSTGGIGILATNEASVSLLGSQLLSGAVGLEVDGAKALVENTVFSGQSAAAMRVLNGAIVDAGDCAGGNVTGLGTGSGANGSSAGGNEFGGHEGGLPWAIKNLNTSSQPTILAQNNHFGASQNIELLLYDDTDDPALSAVTFSQPVLTVSCPPNVSVPCLGDAPAGAQTLAAFLAQGGVASSSPASVSFIDGPLTPGPVEGTITRTYTITDDCGGSADCAQTITVHDTFAPVITTCAINQVLAAGPDCAALVPDLTTQIVATDNCGTVNLSQTPAAGTLIPLGPTVVTITASDLGGNSSDCAATLLVVDATPPSVTCQNISVNLIDGFAGITAAQVITSASDNCGSVDLSVSPNIFTCANIGPNAVVVAARDVHGNVSTCNATVTVIFAQAAVMIHCPADLSVPCLAGVPAAAATLAEFQAQGGAFSDSSATLSHIDGPLTPGPVEGTITRTYTITDACGGSVSCAQTITVHDTESPAIATCATNQVLPAGLACAALVPDLTTQILASDNCGTVHLSQNPVAGTLIPLGPTMVTITASDLGGNSSDCTATLLVVDATPPSVTCQNISVNLVDGFAGITTAQVVTSASDNCGSVDLSVSPNTFTCANIGPNAVIVTARDVHGNVSTCNATVTVIFAEAAVMITCPADLSVPCLAGVPAAAATLAEFEAQGGAFSDSSATLSHIDTPLTPGPVQGTITRTYTITDACGGSTSCIQTITVEDTISPVIACSPNIITNTSPGQCSQVVNFVSSATDNCAGVLLDCSPASGAVFLTGATTVNCTATDAAGHSAQCNFTVQVNDLEAPAIVCANNRIAEATSPSGTPVSFTTTATDNCGPVVIFCSHTSGSVFPIGSTQVFCTACDLNANCSSCHFTVTVADTTAPSLVCLTNRVVACNRPDGAVVSFAPTVSDSGDASPSVICTPPSGSLFPAQTTTAVNCTAADFSHNSSSCSFTVQVIEAPISLTVTRQGADLVLSWPVTCVSYLLDETPSLELPVPWVQSVTPIVVVDFTNTVTETMSANRFFRLRAP
jgi:hypothetical protein